MIELFGLVFGGVSRLAQHWLDLKDKQKERDHEHRMLEKQVEMQDKRLAHDAEMRRGELAASANLAELGLLETAINSQAREAVAAGGWVAKLSACIRPVLTIYHAIFIYTLVKVALFIVATNGGLTWTAAMLSIYGEFDRALLGSMVSFYFADRSLRNSK